MNRLFYILLLVGAVLVGFVGGLFLFKVPLNTQGSANRQGEVIIQNPDIASILRGPGKFSLSRSNIKSWSSDTNLEISDVSPAKTAVILWVFSDIAPAQNFRFRLKVVAGSAGASWSQFNVTFKGGALAARKYYFAFHQGSGKFIPQQQASRQTVKVVKDGEYWVFEMQGMSPGEKSRMLIELLPVIGKPPKTGTLGIQSIIITKN